jgi:2-dehydro-3-deoxyphosphogluconate aldolase/(4S)-4-hydroxy-2-oxoglutarate aldolase
MLQHKNMAGTDVPEFLTLSPVIPVVTLTDVAIACDLAQALLRGGVRVIEITLRNEQGLKTIETIARQVPQMTVGAGTVLNSEDLRAAADAGATFAVSPGVTPHMLGQARSARIAYLPAIASPSELMVALEAGYRHLKFFPASAAGGIEMLRALASPFPQASFCATGGITAQNAPEYLRLPNVSCVGGSWLTPADALARRNWAHIESLAANAIALRGPTAER